MKKLIILILPLTLISARQVYGQSPDSVLATVHYNFSQVIDTTMRDAVKVDDVVLFLGKESSLSTSYDEMQTEAKLAEMERQHPGSVNGLTLSYGMPFMFYKNANNKKLISRAKFKGDNYVIEEITPTQDWQIKSDTKDIKGYKCQKAMTIFRGRSYEAWFCADLPYRNGPWKLGGLPGLILEASDTKKEVIFTFTSFGKGNPDHVAMALPTPAISTTFRELKKAVDAVLHDQAGKQSGAITISDMTPGNTTTKRREYNNPIEKDWDKR